MKWSVKWQITPVYCTSVYGNGNIIIRMNGV